MSETSGGEVADAGAGAGADGAGAGCARYAGTGCLTAVIGLFAGGMIGIFIGKLVEGAKGCPVPEGLPTCNWWIYWGWGAAIGVLSLPTLTLWRLRSGARPSDRG